MTEPQILSLARTVCSFEGVRCSRDAPIIFGPQGISGPDDSGIVGHLSVHMGEQVADATYKFFARHNLFEKKWDFSALLDQICKRFQGLKNNCGRKKAIKYYNDSFIMGDGVDLGSLVIWQDEEVIDVLHAIRMKHPQNITIHDQMRAFSRICHREEVECQKTNATVFKINNINWRDYPFFWNETCEVYVAGWQHMSDMGKVWKGDKIVEFLKREDIEAALRWPLLGPLFLFLWSLFLYLMSYCSGKQTNLNRIQKIILPIVAFATGSFIFTAFVEPTDMIDRAMHSREYLPDLEIFENEEPADAVMRWAKEASRKHHPIVRQPIHEMLLEHVCARTDLFNCTRRRAWELMDFGHITVASQSYQLYHMDPRADPVMKGACVTTNALDPCIERTARLHCGRIVPPPMGCVRDLARHMANQYREFNRGRGSSKNAYTKLVLEMDATHEEIFRRAARLVRQRGMNFPPLARVGNGTAKMYYDHDKRSMAAYGYWDAFQRLKDKEAREWTDKPCTPMF
eukprot:CAMPEP_0113321936 /NCGR_PEP_ID=MMETSP0010_2-20120614/15250_1 /TAXON_ID=216773 ORGANISM="Corethron hystrix, Strain 308" /NCGR_SAMPLE_ID=MMETSP0010_2 /ASSEMBLY_ACC=CAM_ASM_000155 /LENGTH=513 /DNA_ID=CAMNT_0000180227 /DNA_START=13 /DNA_END=1551 /DNA_ORIENTATION=- /assembly_acc=CAM_ASM_000155